VSERQSDIRRDIIKIAISIALIFEVNSERHVYFQLFCAFVKTSVPKSLGMAVNVSGHWAGYSPKYAVGSKFWLVF